MCVCVFVCVCVCVCVCLCVCVCVCTFVSVCVFFLVFGNTKNEFYKEGGGGFQFSLSKMYYKKEGSVKFH